jgi:predicted transposase/invertase (TIGR01784 family)
MKRGRYVNFFTDFGFNRLFGSEPAKDCLKDFLNALLCDLERPIIDLQFKQNEHLGATGLDRGAVFDLYCENDRGEKIIVELQKAKQKFFKDRSVFYSTFPIQEQAQSGEWDFRLKAVYTVGILGFVFDDDLSEKDRYHFAVKLTDQETKRVFYDKLTFVYLAMPNFKKSLAELETQLDRWLYAMRHLASLENMPEGFHDEVFRRFFEMAEVARFSPDEKQSYERSLKSYRDLNNVIQTAVEEHSEKLTAALNQKTQVQESQREEAERRFAEERRAREDAERLRAEESLRREQSERQQAAILEQLAAMQKEIEALRDR